MALDAFGRNSQAGWAAGFVTLAIGVGFGRWAIGRSGRIDRAEGEAA